MITYIFANQNIHIKILGAMRNTTNKKIEKNFLLRIDRYTEHKGNIIWQTRKSPAKIDIQ